ncbi:MAG: nucleotide-binding protein [Gemmatimonadetes bacterium]|nr:nucleotide-binding protein [Gemmatimonadota bacterium]
MTRPPKDKAIQRLQKALNAIEDLKQQQRRSSSPEFQKWDRNTEIAIANTFGENSRHVSDFTSISYVPPIATSGMTGSDYHGWYISGLEQATSVLQSMIEEVEEYWEDDSLAAGVSTSDNKTSPEHLRDVFIIHGRDDGTKEIVARFIERLGLKPIILHEEPNQGQTIIEKFEQHAEVAFAIALLTPDDTGGLADKEQPHKPRARQNVIFEFGYFMGKLGRQRVCALKKENVETPSDYDGVLYIPFDESGAWRMKLVGELKTAGLDVDANRAF